MISRSTSPFELLRRFRVLGLLLVSSIALQLAPSRAEGPTTPARTRCDALGDPLPDGAIFRVGTTRLRPGKDNFGKVVDASFSPDGRRLAVTFGRDAVRLFDAISGRSLRRLPECQFVAFSPDGGRLLVREHDESLRILDTSNGEVRVRLRGSKKDQFGVWRPDGKVIVTLGSNDRESPIRIWDAVTGKPLRQLENVKDFLGVRCSSDAKMIAIVDGDDKVNRIRLFASDTGKELRLLTKCCNTVEFRAERAQENGVLSVSGAVGMSPRFSPDGKVLLAGCDKKSFALWDVATGKRLVRLKCSEVLPLKTRFSPDGKLLALLDMRGDLCLVDTATGRIRHRLTGKDGNLSWIIHFSFNWTFSPDGRLLAAAHDGRLLAAAHDEHNLVLCETATGQAIRTWPGHDKGQIQRMEFSPDGRRLATVSADGTALVWDVTGRIPEGRLETRPLSAEQTEQAWGDLSGSDAAKAHQAIWRLIAAPTDALALLRQRLKPVEAVEKTRIERLILDLDSDAFAVREKATDELRMLGELTGPAIRKTLASRPTLEMRRRLQELLEESNNRQWHPSAALLRQLRAIEVLEHIGTPEAQKLLESLAEGEAGARLTQEARAAVQRLKAHHGAKP